MSLTRKDLPGLPRESVATYLGRELGLDSDWSAEVISGGLSNLTYRIEAGDQRLVLRRPPLGHALRGAHDMRREHRALVALGPTPVPVPEVLALCDDEKVLGAPFYVMREVRGLVVRDAAEAGELTPEQRAALSDGLVDALGDLHSVDVDAVGLGDFGKRGGYAARQVRTWGKQWQNSRTRELPDMDRLLARLEEAVPADEETTVVHGDYRLDNTIVNTAPPRVLAILDWELATLGHPVVDLASMLTYWHDRDDVERGSISVAAGLTTLPGFRTTTELAERYAARTGRDLSQLPIYLALAAMKLAAILEGVHARHLGGLAVGEGYDKVGTAVPVLAARGLRLLDGA
ncbi:phosphotransferase family protein (plasmid) [Embleya sp. NBC_00888]|uniref:phosphotransferase family protein n=1 Tax=Embleya sp. NBC_00888 TaxID=2975960 RepID=UPI002F91579A|nr:phosphotransferase family protein [Embleya sp. NBC_00888]